MFSSLCKATLCLTLAVATTVIVSLSAQAAGDPAAGTWELNVEKSKFIPGPPPMSKIRTYEVTGQQDTMISRTVDAKGNQTVHQYKANRDGKDYPFEGWAMADTIAMTPVDSFKMTYTMKKAGEVVVTGIREVSQDEKTMTITMKFTTAQGQKVDNTEVLEKR
jgi:hypothetical protein